MTRIQQLLMCLAEIQENESDDTYFVCGDLPKELIDELKEEYGLI